MGKKGGPATEGGKEIARWNATRHGMRSPAPVVPGIETPEDWERHLVGTLESLAPEGHLETVLAERVALLSWRLHRVTRYETGAIALPQRAIKDDVHEESHFLGSLRGRAHETRKAAEATDNFLYPMKEALANLATLRRGLRHIARGLWEVSAVLRRPKVAG